MAEEKQDFVQKRLDMIDWKALYEQCGVSRKTVENNPFIAKQLADGRMTDLVEGSKPEFSGQFSLRAIYYGDKVDMKIFTIEPEKRIEKAFEYKKDKDGNLVQDENGEPVKVPQYKISGLASDHYITSERIIKNLLEKSEWTNNKGEKISGYANANGGASVKVEWTERTALKNEDGTPKLDDKGKQMYEVKPKYDYYMVSYHQPTHRFIGMPTRAVKNILLNDDGTAKKGKTMYGKEFTAEQLNKLANGECVKMTGCRKKDSKETFDCYVQFSATERQIVPCHPVWAMKEARAKGQTVQQVAAEKPAQQQAAAPAKEQKKGAAQAQKPAQAPKEEKKNTSKIKISR